MHLTYHNARQQETNVEGVKKVLSVGVDGDTESEYRIQVNNQVKYIVVQPGIYDFDEILSFPPALLENLPPCPPGNWTSMNIARSADGTPICTISSKLLEALARIWHPKMVDVLKLKEMGHFGARVCIVEWEGREVVALILRFSVWKTKPVYMRSSSKTNSSIRILQRYLLLSLAISPKMDESWAC